MRTIIVYISGLFCIFFYSCKAGYKRELNKIEESLNSINNIEVLGIWGNNDISIEEVSARVVINNNVELVLANLSKDVYNYPNSVYISKIGDYTFSTIQENQPILSFNIDLGSSSSLGKTLNIHFGKPEDVVIHYDKILELIDSLPHSPNNFKYFKIVKKDTIYFTCTIDLISSN